jgi:hypothetical protein
MVTDFQINNPEVPSYTVENAIANIQQKEDASARFI